MSMGTSLATRGNVPWSEKLIKALIYSIVAGAVAFFLSTYVDGFADEMGIPFRGELLTIMISIFIAIVFTTMLIGIWKKNYVRSGSLG